VFCEAHQPWQNDAAINAVIGTAAAAAVRALTEQAALTRTGILAQARRRGRTGETP
jgi:hypothetical protein